MQRKLESEAESQVTDESNVNDSETDTDDIDEATESSEDGNG
ncbi:MAG: hypothetical protein AAFN77_21455 [Planctomycetota bacterium]